VFQQGFDGGPLRERVGGGLAQGLLGHPSNVNPLKPI
jgi:hypothetical protein